MENKNHTRKDTLFTNDFESGSFRFDSSVVNVFDNMIERSIPLYWEMQQILCEFIYRIYDQQSKTVATPKVEHNVKSEHRSEENKHRSEENEHRSEEKPLRVYLWVAELDLRMFPKMVGLI
jgi:hypothetical protein